MTKPVYVIRGSSLSSFRRRLLTSLRHALNPRTPAVTESEMSPLNRHRIRVYRILFLPRTECSLNYRVALGSAALVVADRNFTRGINY